MMWKIGFVLGAVLWRGQAQVVGNGSCSASATDLDRALASLFGNLDGEFEITDREEIRLYPGLSLGRAYLRGLKELAILKPYLVYCDSSDYNAKTRVNVEFEVKNRLEVSTSLRFCSYEAVLRSHLYDGRFIVVFEVEDSIDRSGVSLRPKELRPLWIEFFTVRVEGIPTSLTEAVKVITVLFSQITRHYWAMIIENYGLGALRAAAQRL